MQKMQVLFDFTKEKDANYPNPYEIACWPDDIRSAGLGVTNGWHYYWYPIYDGIKREDATIIANPDYSVVNTVVF